MNKNTRMFNMMVGEKSNIIPLLMVKGKRDKRIVVRLTGGCGFMNQKDAAPLYKYASAFEHIEGLVAIAGGTRMFRLEDCKTIIPGITELLPRIKKLNPASKTVGIVPKIEDSNEEGAERTEMLLLPDGRVGFHSTGCDYITTFMPGNDVIVQIQKDVDTGCRWLDEVATAQHWMRLLQEEADFKVVTVFYNGGGTTQKELLLNIKYGWPVILIKGSGRITDQYANDTAFLAMNPNVIVVETPRQLRKVLESLNK